MRKIISFSLWGDKPIYTVGAISNAVLAQTIYPDWICRFYIHRPSVPKYVIEELAKQPNVELVDMPEDIGWSAMLWRFYPATEDNVSVMISRDCDSRLSLREKACVDHWLNESKRNVMTIRDTCVHQSQMMGGMWGVKDGFLKFIKPYLDRLIEQTKHTAIKGVDQDFLNTKIYLYALGILNLNFDIISKTVEIIPESQFVSYDDIAFGVKRFGDMEHRPHDKEWILPTIIQREYGDNYLPCIHCGLKHDNTYIGKCESVTLDESKYLNLTEEELQDKKNIIEFVKYYTIKQDKYGLSPLQHEHGSEKIKND